MWWGRAQPPGPRRRSAAAAAAQGARAPRTRSWGKSRTSRAPRSLPPPRRPSGGDRSRPRPWGLRADFRVRREIRHLGISTRRRADPRGWERRRTSSSPAPRTAPPSPPSPRSGASPSPPPRTAARAAATRTFSRPSLRAPLPLRAPLAFPSRRERKDTARTGPAPQRLRGRRPRRARCSRCRAPRPPPRDASSRRRAPASRSPSRTGRTAPPRTRPRTSPATGPPPCRGAAGHLSPMRAAARPAARRRPARTTRTRERSASFFFPLPVFLVKATFERARRDCLLLPHLSAPRFENPRARYLDRDPRGKSRSRRRRPRPRRHPSSRRPGRRTRAPPSRRARGPSPAATSGYKPTFGL